MGRQTWKGNKDMLNVILIDLAKELPMQDESLHRLLGTLLSQNLSANEKIEILEADYELLRNDVGKDVIAVSNLAEGILEKGHIDLIAINSKNPEFHEEAKENKKSEHTGALAFCLFRHQKQKVIKGSVLPSSKAFWGILLLI